MPEIIQLSQDAYDLWTKMLEKGGTFNNENLKQLLGKPANKQLKDELIKNNLIKLHASKPKQVYIALSIDGKVEIKTEQKKVIKNRKPPSKTAGSAQDMSFSEIMVQINKYCQPYFDKIEDLTSELLELKKIVQNLIDNQYIIQSKSIELESEQIDFEAFFKSLQMVCIQLNKSSRFGGLIPIFEIWQLMKQENSNLNRTQFQKILLQLENERKIDLNIANDPSQVRYPESGINVPNRGLIYYVSIRT